MAQSSSCKDSIKLEIFILACEQVPNLLCTSRKYPSGPIKSELTDLNYASSALCMYVLGHY
jgi:hypothetical protein